METAELLDIVDIKEEGEDLAFHYFLHFESIRQCLDSELHGILGKFPFFELDYSQEKIKNYLGFTFFEAKKCTKIGMRLRGDDGMSRSQI